MKRSGEQLSGSVEKPKSTDRYAGYRRCEKLVRTIMASGLELRKQTFDTEEEAEQASESAIDTWLDDFVELQGTYNRIPLRVAGEGVYVPAIDLRPVVHEGNQGVFVGVNSEQTFNKLPMFENKTGYLSGYLSALQQDPESDKYFSELCILLDDMQPTPVRINYPGLPVPLIYADVYSRFFVKSVEGTDIEFPGTELVDARQRAIETLAENGIAKNRFVAQLNKVSAALYNRSPEGEQLKAIDRVRWIARQSERFVADGSCQADVMSNAILSTFGKNRYFEFEGAQAPIGQFQPEKKDKDADKPEKYGGLLVDAFMYSDKKHGLTPVLAINNPYNDLDGMKYVLLREVQSIKF